MNETFPALQEFFQGLENRQPPVPSITHPDRQQRPQRAGYQEVQGLEGTVRKKERETPHDDQQRASASMVLSQKGRSTLITSQGGGPRKVGGPS